MHHLPQSITNYHITNCNNSSTIVNHSSCIITTNHLGNSINNCCNLIITAIITIVSNYLQYSDPKIVSLSINN